MENIWEGWKFGKWGRSSAIWLLAPDGSRFSPAEILDVAAMRTDLDYLRRRVRELESQVDGAAAYFTIEEIGAVRLVVDALRRTLPPSMRLVVGP